MRKKIRKKTPVLLRDDESGSELTEFLLLLPLFLFIVSMMISFAQLTYGGIIAMDAANSGCRLAIVEESMAEAERKAVGAAGRIVGNAGMNVSFQSAKLTVEGGGSWKRGNIAACEVTVSVRPVFPMASVSGVFSREIPITKVCPMMIERNGE